MWIALGEIRLALDLVNGLKCSFLDNSLIAADRTSDEGGRHYYSLRSILEKIIFLKKVYENDCFHETIHVHRSTKAARWVAGDLGKTEQNDGLSDACCGCEYRNLQKFLQPKISKLLRIIKFMAGNISNSFGTQKFLLSLASCCLVSGSRSIRTMQETDPQMIWCQWRSENVLENGEQCLFNSLFRSRWKNYNDIRTGCVLEHATKRKVIVSSRMDGSEKS